MNTDTLHAAASIAALATMSAAIADAGCAKGVYLVECHDADGNLLWSERVENVVATQGKNFLLDSALAGSAYTAAFLLSLFTAGTPVATATYAAPVVTEVTSGVLAARQTLTWTAASAGAKAINNVTCSMIGSATITGIMVVKGSSTIGDTAASSAVLLSAGTFGTAQPVISGNTLTCSYSLSI